MSTLNVANISDDQSTLTGSGQNLNDSLHSNTTVDTKYVTNGCAKAWACLHMNFYLEESFNISTATDLGAAVGSVTLTNSMDTDTYRCGVALALLGGGEGSSAKVDSGDCNSNTLSFSSFDGNNSVSGNVRVGSVIHGDLA